MRWWMTLVVGLGFVAVGCREQDNPPPLLNEGVRIGDGNRTLLPTIVPPLKDRQGLIIGAAASAEEVGSAKASPAGEAAANVVKIEIDASTPEGLMKGFVAIVEAGNIAQLADIVVPEQQEAVRQLAGAVGPLFHGFKAVEAKWKEKFPDTPFPAASFKVPGLDLAAPKVTNVETKSDTEAEATVEKAEGGEPEKVQLKKIDNVWRLDEPKLKMEGDPETIKKFLGAFAELGKALQEFVPRLENNEFASAADGEKALAEVGQKAMGAVMGELMAKMGEAMKNAASPPAGGEPAPAGATAAPAAPETLQPAPSATNVKPEAGAKGKGKPKPADDNAKPKSELEQDMDNAAGRATLGGGI